MAEMYAHCTVTLRPTLTTARIPDVATAIINKLWPGNSGGVVILHRHHLVEKLTPLVDFVRLSGMEQSLRVVRDGMAYRFEDGACDD